MYIYGSTESTRVLNPEVDNWREEIDGDYIPTVTLQGITTSLLDIIYKGIKSELKKAESFEAIEYWANLGKQIEDAFKEGQSKAHEKNEAAYNTLQKWKAEKESKNNGTANEE